MKGLAIGAVLIISLLLSFGCKPSGYVMQEDKTEASDPTIDSLEQARLNRLDSASQIKVNPNTPSSNFTNSPKTVKKKVEKN